MAGKFLKKANPEAIADEPKPKTKTVAKELKPKFINISARIPRRTRRWWMAQCAMGTDSASDIIVKAFMDRFGEPPESFTDDPRDWEE
jgi:hypothetical protein